MGLAIMEIVLLVLIVLMSMDSALEKPTIVDVLCSMGPSVLCARMDMHLSQTDTPDSPKCQFSALRSTRKSTIAELMFKREESLLAKFVKMDTRQSMDRLVRDGTALTSSYKVPRPVPGELDRTLLPPDASSVLMDTQ